MPNGQGLPPFGISRTGRARHLRTVPTARHGSWVPSILGDVMGGGATVLHRAGDHQLVRCNVAMTRLESRVAGFSVATPCLIAFMVAQTLRAFWGRLLEAGPSGGRLLGVGPSRSRPLGPAGHKKAVVNL